MPEPIRHVLDETAELQSLQSRLEQIRRLQRRYRTIAPERLAETSRVCAIDGTTVVVCAASGAVAAALRHLAPRLLEGLREAARKSSKHARDQELNAIRIEVQVSDKPPPRPVRPRAPLPMDKLSEVAAGLAPSPLREALERIAKPPQSSKTRSKT
jgi:hypothetical protein